MIYKCNKCSHEHETEITACEKCGHFYFQKIEPVTVQDKLRYCICGKKHDGVIETVEHKATSICNTIAIISLFLTPLALVALIKIFGGSDMTFGKAIGNHYFKFLMVGIIPFSVFRLIAYFFREQGRWICSRCQKENRVNIETMANQAVKSSP